MNAKQKNETKKIFLASSGTMLVIIFAWYAWFYPKERADKSSEYEKFKQDIKSAFSIFKSEGKKSDALEVDVDKLRQRVFGDTSAKNINKQTSNTKETPNAKTPNDK